VKGTGFFVYYKAALAAVVVSLIFGVFGRRIYFLDLLLFAISFKGAWDSARAVSMMGLFLSPGISLHVTGFLERVRDWSDERDRRETAKREKERGKGKGGGKGGKQGKPAEQELHSAQGSGRHPHRWLRPATAGFIVVSCLLFGGITLGFSFSQLEYGVGMTEHKFSFGAADFLRKNPPRGNMFNFFDIGGFLDWQLYPNALTFIDGRTYNAKVFMEHQTVTGGMPGWKDVLNRYGVTYVVTKTMDSSGMILPLIPIFANDPDWTLVFSDGLFVVFVRNGPENRDLIARHRIPNGALPYHVIREAYHYMYLEVSRWCCQTMSNMYMLWEPSFAVRMLSSPSKGGRSDAQGASRRSSKAVRRRHTHPEMTPRKVDQKRIIVIPAYNEEDTLLGGAGRHVDLGMWWSMMGRLTVPVGSSGVFRLFPSTASTSVTARPFRPGCYTPSGGYEFLALMDADGQHSLPGSVCSMNSERMGHGHQVPVRGDVDVYGPFSAGRNRFSPLFIFSAESVRDVTSGFQRCGMSLSFFHEYPTPPGRQGHVMLGRERFRSEVATSVRGSGRHLDMLNVRRRSTTRSSILSSIIVLLRLLREK
jgi:hypothetical protein